MIDRSTTRRCSTFDAFLCSCFALFAACTSDGTPTHDGGSALDARTSPPDAGESLDAGEQRSDAGPGTDAYVAPIPRGHWTRLDSGGGPAGAYFYRSVVIEGGGVWMGWGQPDIGAHGGNFVFDASSNAWARTNEVSDDPSRNIGNRENYGAWYDDDRHSVWIGNGAPVSFGYPEGPQSGDMRYDVAADTFTLEFPDYGPEARAIGAGDGALVYHDDVLYRFGGWSIGPNQVLASHHLVSGEITFGIAADTTPAWTGEPARLSYARSGIDSRTGVLWTLAEGGELYTIDPRAAAPAWEHVPTTGERPGGVSLGAALHEAASSIVAFVGVDALVGGAGGADLGDTWILDLETRVWRYGPRASLGDEVPPRYPAAVWVMNYDRANERVVMTVSRDAVCEVWAFAPIE
jgi:hypothetical protein